jgi:hypothetical protein
LDAEQLQHKTAAQKTEVYVRGHLTMSTQQLERSELEGTSISNSGAVWFHLRLDFGV